MVAMRVKRTNYFQDQYEQIKEYARDKEVGWQGSGYLCPFCKGGATGKDKSLSVSRDYIQVKWMCHRDTCKSAGTVLLTSNPKETPQKQEVAFKVAKPAYSRDLTEPKCEALNQFQMDFLVDQYGLDRKDVEKAIWLWDNLHNRLWMPIHKPDHSRFTGHVLRAFDKKQRSKCITVVTDPTTIAADWFYRFVGDTRLIVVEDQISACKVARQFNSLALLGTRMGDALVAEIKKFHFRKVFLVLDKDALQTALDHQAKYSELFDVFKVIQPEKDLKYLSDKQIKELVEANNKT